MSHRNFTNALNEIVPSLINKALPIDKYAHLAIRTFKSNYILLQQTKVPFI